VLTEAAHILPNNVTLIRVGKWRFFLLTFSANLLSSSLLSKNIKIKIYRTIILPPVLYGCETWLLILREKCWLSVSANRVLRGISEPKMAEVNRGL
jgi:hypothetical protein